VPAETATKMKHEDIVDSVRRWVEAVVIDLNLCPFAKRELVKNRVRFAVTEAVTEEQLLEALRIELETLCGNSAIETTLLIHPAVLQDFYDYNQFLDDADGLLARMGLDGVIQIASFHPDYQFGGTEPDDVENYTNRSPYPVLHLLREESLSRAIQGHPDSLEIPEQNVRLLKKLGRTKMQALLEACFRDDD